LSNKPEYQGSDDQLLTLKDRINYAYILSKQLLTIQSAILAREEGEIKESIDGLVSIIPTAYKDPLFFKDLKKTKTQTLVYDYWCGIKLEETAKEKPSENYYSKLQACTDLLQRRGMLSRTRWREIATGKEWNPETLKEADILGDLGP